MAGSFMAKNAGLLGARKIAAEKLASVTRVKIRSDKLRILRAK